MSKQAAKHTQSGMRSGLRADLLRSPIAWTIASLLLAVGLHAVALPLWATAAFAALATWRGVISARSLPLPARGLRVLAVILLTIAVLAGYQTFNGLEAGTALLTLMAGLKLLETRVPRDHVVLMLLCYFLVLAAFLRAQYLWALPLYAVSIWLTTASLLRATQSADALRPAACLRLSGRMLLQAMPLMLILFLLFPRVPGPFWALPKGDRASSGLGDTMSPGDISELTLSSEPAFRVRFAGAAPAPAQRYWRGPVLHEFDGYSWRMARSAYLGSQLSFSGRAYDYNIMMEPSGNRWVFALDMPESWRQGRIRQTFDFQLLAPNAIDQPITYTITSRPSYRTETAPGMMLTRLDTRLPANRNMRTLELAGRLRLQAGDDSTYIRDILRMFGEQNFFYTLTPPRLDYNSVDDFLFNTRSGFCAHYASAFTMLMRAAGIPARVVTGYQGGEYNRMGGYYIVRQSDAHAWSEVWLAGRGWVRVDPTAAVAPERIERGSMQALGEDAAITERLMSRNPWLADVRFAWDAINTLWRERVLDFNERSQFDFMKFLGIDDPDWRSLATSMGVALTVALLLLSFKLAREMNFRAADPIVRAYRRFCGHVARLGLTRAAHEAPLDFARRIRASRPDVSAQADTVTQLYLELRYAGRGSIAELERRVRNFKPR